MTKETSKSVDLALELPVLFGNERALSNDLQRMGIKQKDFILKNGRAIIPIKEEKELASQIAYLNLRSRIAERVLLRVAKGMAQDFDQLFALVGAVNWQKYLNDGAAFTVRGFSRDSQLTSIPACQSVIKKAICLSLLRAKALPEDSILPEDPEKGEHEIQFSLVDDQLSLMIDTSGEPLYKRSYRVKNHEAPLRETTAAALLEYSYINNVFKYGGTVIDLFCGSGTLAIEAALLALDYAPGRLREYAAEEMDFIGQKVFDRQRKKLEENRKPIIAEEQSVIWAFDIDKTAIDKAKINAKQAGVGHLINFRQLDSRQIRLEHLLNLTGADEILFLANPPYGERLEDVETARNINKDLGKWLRRPLQEQNIRLSLSLITAAEYFEKDFAMKAKKRRKLYNGPIACTLYNYF